MSGLVARSQASNLSCRLRNELMFQETIRIPIFVAAVCDRRKRWGRPPGGAIRLRRMSSESLKHGRDSARPSNYNSTSTPGGGMIISLSGKASAADLRIHSTAGTSPCTSTSFFGATFLI